MKKYYKTCTFILFGLLLLCIESSCKNNTHDISFSQSLPLMGTSRQERASTIIRLWENQAFQHEIDGEVISHVSNLINQVTNTREFVQFADNEVYRPMATKTIEESLNRFLDQFKPYYIDPEKRSGTSYWTAWLLVQCIKRHQPSIDDIREIKLWFEEFKKNVSLAVVENTREALSLEDFLKYEQQIEQTQIWIGKTLDFYFNEFSTDPLFPLFKRPLSDIEEKDVLNRIANSTRFKGSIKRRRKLMVLEEEYIVRQMEIAYGHIPQEAIFYAILSSNIDEWQKNEYWGGMLWRASTGVAVKGIWPVEVYLRKIPSID